MEEKRILIAEKDGAIATYIKSFFKGREYKIIESKNGDEAWRVFQEAAPDLVIANTMIEGLGGMELFERIFVNAPEIPVILTADECHCEDVGAILESGVFDFICAPHREISVFRHAVKKALIHSSLIRKNLDYIENLERLVEQKTTELKLQNLKLEEEIRERKRIELLIEHAKREWESTIDAIPDMIALLDRNFTIVRMNRAMADAMGKEPAEAVGMKCFKALHGENSPPDYCPHAALIKDGRMHSVEIYDERLGGHHEITVVPYLDTEGTLVGAVHVIRNINARKKMELEKERMQTQLLQQHKLESVGQLAAGIAHEINTPTQYVGTNIDFLDEAFQDIQLFVDQMQEVLEAFEQGKVNQELVEQSRDAFDQADWEYLKEEIPLAIEQSRDGVRRVTSIVRAMKEFSHPGGSEKEPCDLNKILETTVTIARNEWKYVAEMELELESALPQVPCLADEMGQVLLNLIVNAAQAIGEKLGDNPEGEKGAITIKTAYDDDWAIVTITDSGSGIPEEIGKKIFEPFFTTKKLGRSTGQGLAIAHNVVMEKHGGNIDFQSKPGEGTTFVLRLPIK